MYVLHDDRKNKTVLNDDDYDDAVVILQVVELIMFNIGTFFNRPGHPMHIHGYNYRVLSTRHVSQFRHSTSHCFSRVPKA